MSVLSVLNLSRQHGSVICVDLGSATTKVWQQGQLLFHEPSLIVTDAAKVNAVAIGQGAASLIGKLGEDLQVQPVIKSASLTDPELLLLFLRGLNEKIAKQNIKNWWGQQVVYSLDSSVSGFARQLFARAFQEAGWHVYKVVDKADALHAALPRPFLCVVDHGAEVTQVAIYNRSRRVMAVSIPLGTTKYHEEIIRVAQNDLGVKLSQSTAQDILHKIGRVGVGQDKLAQNSKLSIRAGGNQTGAHQTIVINAQQFALGLNHAVDELSELVADELEKTSAETQTELAAHGIMLCGGGALVAGLPARLAANLNLSVDVPDDCQLTVVKGLAAV